MKKILKLVLDDFKNLTEFQRKNLFYGGLSFVFALFSYPFIRSTTTAIFIESNGAKKSPLVWLLSVIVLTVIIHFYNICQRKLFIQKLFFITGISSIAIFIIFTQLFSMEILWASYVLYILKESYIVLLVHSAFAFLNDVLPKDRAKVFYGPLGAIGSLAGVLGGILTHQISGKFSDLGVMAPGLVGILISCFLFMKTSKKMKNRIEEKNKDVTPLGSISDVKKYVFLICTIILLTQFCINLANFKFNIVMEMFYPGKVEKTKFISLSYSYVNGISLFLQLIGVPIMFKAFKEKAIHKFIPFIYCIFFGVSFLTLGSAGLGVFLMFIVFKAFDYSIFSVAKEILYFPLTSMQKYGAKYLADILVYRSAKGVVSFILLFAQNLFWVNLMLISSIILWFITTSILFKERENMRRNNNV